MVAGLGVSAPAPAPRDRALLEEELLFNARDDQFSADSRIHVTYDGDFTDVVAPRGARADVMSSLLFSNPVSFTPYSTTMETIFNYDKTSRRMYTRPAGGHRARQILNLSIYKPRRYRRIIGNRSISDQLTTGVQNAEQPPTSSTSHLACGLAESAFHISSAERPKVPISTMLVERPKVPPREGPAGRPKVPCPVSTERPKVPDRTTPAGRPKVPCNSTPAGRPKVPCNSLPTGRPKSLDTHTHEHFCCNDSLNLNN